MVQYTDVNHVLDRIEILDRVGTLMAWSKDKATLWFETPNPMLGGVSPEALVLMGRGHKVLHFIRDAEEGNHA